MKNRRNIVDAVSANLLSTLVSAIVTLLLPKKLSVDAYGYFQYFLFWSGYLGILHLGWIDGVYLVLGFPSLCFFSLVSVLLVLRDLEMLD